MCDMEKRNISSKFISHFVHLLSWIHVVLLFSYFCEQVYFLFSKGMVESLLIKEKIVNPHRQSNSELI